jgi:hypothetical protein
MLGRTEGSGEANQRDYRTATWGALIELTGCWDPVTGDAILMCRVPCGEIVTH